MSQLTAPFSQDQRISINDFQHCNYWHPFTCENPHTGSDRTLIALDDGMHCPLCDYFQNWVYDWMADGSWRQIENKFGFRNIKREGDKITGEILVELPDPKYS